MNSITIQIVTKDSSKFHDAMKLVLGLKGLLDPGVTLGFQIDSEPEPDDEGIPF